MSRIRVEKRPKCMLKMQLLLPRQLINVLQSKTSACQSLISLFRSAKVVTSFSKDKVKLDIQAKLEQAFSHFMPFSISFDGITAQEDGKFTVSCKMITHEDITAGFIGDVWYDENGQLNTSDLIR